MQRVYLIGSLKNPRVPVVANELRGMGFDVFDDWFACGPEADDYWRDYSKARGHTMREALKSYAARNSFDFDARHIAASDIGVLLAPAGKSAHLELGIMLGRGKPGYVLFEQEPERWDVMYQFATGIFYGLKELEDHFAQEYGALPGLPKGGA